MAMLFEIHPPMRPNCPPALVRVLTLAALATLCGLPLGTSALAATAAAASAPAAAPTGAGRLPAIPPKKKAPAAPVKQMDLNSASRDELKKLPGIGDAEADKIIASRPFLTKAELVTKNIIGAGPYVSLKHLVVAMQKPQKPPKAQKPAASKAPAKTGGKAG